MSDIEISGKTVDEAIQHASEQLGIPRDDLKFTIIKEGKSGILGFGAEEAKILVESASEQQPAAEAGSDSVQKAQEILKQLLVNLGFKADVAKAAPIAAGEDSEDAITSVTFNITGDDDIGILIGRHGQTLSSLQYPFASWFRDRFKPPLPSSWTSTVTNSAVMNRCVLLPLAWRSR
jgi:spoIIIJ-associated protein